MVMRACSVNIDDFPFLKYPLYASVKMDGIRAEITDNIAFSRKLIRLPNNHLQNIFQQFPILNGFEGELIVGEVGQKETYDTTHSAIMSEDGSPNFSLYLFDCFNDVGDFNSRYQKLLSVKDQLPDWCHITEQRLIENYRELLIYEREMYEKGHEGIIIRYPDSLYKKGKSTIKKGEFLRYKRFADAEAEILEINPLFTNQNVLEKDNLGYAKRSSKKEGKVALPLAGSLTVRDIKTKVVFNVSSGIVDLVAKELWGNKEKYIGKYIKYSYFPYGSYQKPRFPVFLGFRDKIDIL